MNKLSDQTSPYLLQHADNPVHWMPWSEQALQLAREQDKPILLSIGYSACHWCHVMAHESFEDNATADVMNRLFINIKVDREERPDLDKIYQTAHSMLTNRPGGWPLTVFLTPHDHMPIYAGTYFPKLPLHGLPAFTQLLENIAHAYATRKDDIRQQSASLQQIFSQIELQHSTRSEHLGSLPLDLTRNQIEQQFDSRYGGYSGAPKFPHPAIIQRALRHWARTNTSGNPDSRILHTALFTLERMAAGGLFDHLGGGFCRYSTDAQWMIPHFEKMLYDNGPLLWLNTDAWCISKDECYKDAVIETAAWVMREMQSEAGGYYSALDADSEGVEGKFYVWTPEAVKALLDERDYALFASRYGLDKPANFEGQWHLHAYRNYTELAEKSGSNENEIRDRLQAARLKLLNAREHRVHPGLDDKILTAWNGMMIRGMAHAGYKLDKPTYIDSAASAADFIYRHLWQNQRLLATARKEHAHLNAYLDDYAFLISGLLELLQARWDSKWLHWAQQLADVLIEQFEDKGSGGFYFTSHDHEQLIQRSKSYSDDAIPSGNGVAAECLLILGYLLSEPKYIDTADRCLKAAWNSINQAAISHCSLLDALDYHLEPPQIIILRGSIEQLKHWLQATRDAYLPHTRLFAIPEDKALPASLQAKALSDQALAYICEGMHCSSPISSISEFRELVNDNKAELEPASRG
ncbi:MAG: thioredoxin domain-containing protein [Gammaproteobacteria bacterium]|nr:thioredoxin domain-containing protein [Gammaproteobacteria bacterium]